MLESEKFDDEISVDAVLDAYEKYEKEKEKFQNISGFFKDEEVIREIYYKLTYLNILEYLNSNKNILEKIKNEEYTKQKLNIYKTKYQAIVGNAW